MCISPAPFFFFFFNDTATTEIYTLSLHDALPISPRGRRVDRDGRSDRCVIGGRRDHRGVRESEGQRRLRRGAVRSEEHTSELQSQSNIVCRLLLEKKKKKKKKTISTQDTRRTQVR